MYENGNLQELFQGDAFTHILLTLRAAEPRADVFVGLRFLLYNFGLRLAIARGRRLALVISTSFARRNKKGVMGVCLIHFTL